MNHHGPACDQFIQAHRFIERSYCGDGSVGKLDDVAAPVPSESGIVSFHGGRSFSPVPEMRTRVEAVAAIIDDSWSAFLLTYRLPLRGRVVLATRTIRPVTIIGSSLDFTWDDLAGMADVDDDTELYTYSASPNSRVNEVQFRLLNDGNPMGQVVFRRKSGQPLMIMMHYGPGASPKHEVDIVTTAEEDGSGGRVAPNVKLISQLGANAP